MPLISGIPEISTGQGIEVGMTRLPDRKIADIARKLEENSKEQFMMEDWAFLKVNLVFTTEYMELHRVKRDVVHATGAFSRFNFENC